MKIIKKYINMIKLFSCLIAVNLLLFIVFNLVATTILRDSLPNGLFNPNCKYFTVNASQEFIDFGFIEENDYNVSLLKQPQSDGLLDYQIIYSNISFSINSGRAFNSCDFKSGKNIVLLGDDISKSMPSNSIMIGNISYDVIGTVDFENINSYAYYYTNGKINYVNSNGIFILDGKKAVDINKAFDKIKNNLSQTGFEVIEYEAEKKSLIDILDYSKLLMIMLILIIIVYIIFIYYISSFWINSNKRYLALQWILGNSRIATQLSFTYLIFYASSIALSYILSRIIIPNSLSFVIVLTIICMFIELFLTIYKLHSLINCSINDLLEED